LSTLPYYTQKHFPFGTQKYIESDRSRSITDWARLNIHYSYRMKFKKFNIF